MAKKIEYRNWDWLERFEVARAEEKKNEGGVAVPGFGFYCEGNFEFAGGLCFEQCEKCKNKTI